MSCLTTPLQRLRAWERSLRKVESDSRVKGKPGRKVNPERYPCGHPRTDENSYAYGTKTCCKVCKTARTSRYYAENLEKRREYGRRYHKELDALPKAMKGAR